MDNKDNLTIYERITILIPMVKEIENIGLKKNLTFKLRKVMDDVKELKIKYESLGANVDAQFMQEKNRVEITSASVLDEIESILGIDKTSEEEPKLIK